MILRFKNQIDLEAFAKLVAKQTFINLEKLTIVMPSDEGAKVLAIKSFQATVINSPNQPNYSELL